MKWSEIVMLVANVRKHREMVASARGRTKSVTNYVPRTRRHNGITMVGIPNKIAKRMG